MQKAIGYLMRYGGGATIAWTMLQTVQYSMLPEETIGGVIAGGIVYMIGDRMKMREIAEEHLQLEKTKYEAEKGHFKSELDHWRKVESHLENIANGGISSNLPGDE